MTHTELQAMLSSDERHWWYRGRRRVLRAELDRLPRPAAARLLDAGCGSGRTLDELARYGRASGIDLSAKAVAAARRRGHDDVQVAAVEDMPFPDATFVSDTHFNALLLAPAAAIRLGQRGRHAHAHSDLELTPRVLDGVFEWPLRLESRLVAAGTRLPAGLSLLAVLRRPVLREAVAA